MQITSSAFEHNTSIPSKYTCDGDRPTNPPLSISGVPEEAKSLALIMDDPDVPKQLRPDGVFDHWVLFNIPVETKEIPEGTSAGTPGANTGGGNAYTGPCPPPQFEPAEHRYIFKLYALDIELDVGPGAEKRKVIEAMQGHILAEAELIGKYKRQ
ncbi:MAG: YbhB/YbcL family Raf kinase inhibitor-like protein [Candidatus Zambryskibacteria bacterium]|nr:YbhB/YbcL family Raf kinase inhibitor-like protein [Candidatus Zambryskibacteria bacterium]